jgi:small subunit ribosomal protein S9
MAEIKTIKSKRQIKRDYTYAVGRRKESVARVRLYSHIKEGAVWGKSELVKNQILVNEMPVEHYFSGPIAKAKYMRPLSITDTAEKFAITVKVAGGGKAGQLDAMIHGIARALAAIDVAKYRPTLKKAGMLTRDARARQRRQVGTGGKARRQKSSPKR